MRNKMFDPALKNKHDGVSKSLAAEVMRDLVGAKLLTNNVKEDSGDFSAGFWDQCYELPNGQRRLVEAEMKDSKWWGEHFDKDRPFRYEDMDIPYRKVKNQAHIHMVLSTCRTFGFVVTRKAMDDHLQEVGQPKVKRTMYETQGAPYFSTPVEKGFFVHKGQDGRWRRWKKT